MPRRPKIGPLSPARRKRPPRRAPTRRPVRFKKPRLYISSILAWADAHHRKMGRWPTSHSGTVPEAPWENWAIIDQALRHGCRGCRSRSSLAILLHRHRGRPLPRPWPRPRLTVRQILVWADAYHRRSAEWPAAHSPGRVADGRDEAWPTLDSALRAGTRGLPGGDSLANVLHRCRGVQRGPYRPRLTIRQILAWADEYHARQRRWPKLASGKVKGAHSDTWWAIHTALEHGMRGLRPGYTLATLLAKYRGASYRRSLCRFSEPQIISWADTYQRRHGSWPTRNSGPIHEAPGETWTKVAGALAKGQRGLPGGSSLPCLLERYGRRKRRAWHYHPPRENPLTTERILAWADEFQRRTGRWPATLSGPIDGTRDETWASVDDALRRGTRGLLPGSSLARLLEHQRGKRNPHHLPALRVRLILAWADGHYRRHGSYPKVKSGAIPESPGDTWAAVETALRNGSRGLPGHETLFRLLERHGRVGPARRM